MNPTRRFVLAGLTLTMSAPWALRQAAAETPPDFLIIADRLDSLRSMDPAINFEFPASDMIQNVYDRLVELDHEDFSRGLVPGLAESWEISEDGRTVTFRIREGATFHSGNPVTAEDAAYSFRRAVKLNGPPGYIVRQFGYDETNVDDAIRAEDAQTLVMDILADVAPSLLLNCMTAKVFSVVDSQLVAENEVDGDFGSEWLRTNAAGSGPYTFVSWSANDALTMEAAPDHWRQPASLRRVVFRHVPEAATQRLLLERGDVDVARYPAPDDADVIRENDDLELLEVNGGRIFYLALNQQNPVLSDPKVIEAFKWLVDYEAISQNLLNGQWRVQQGFVPLGTMGAMSDMPFSRDPERARALLDEAGFAPEDLTFELLCWNGGIEPIVAQAVQANAAEVGITITLRIAAGSEAFGDFRSRDYEVFCGSWGLGYPDPHYNAGSFADNPDNDDPDNAGKLAWRAAWVDEDIFAQTAAAIAETDAATREQMYFDLQNDFRARAPFVIMFQNTEQAGIRANVEGLVLGQGVSRWHVWTASKS